MNPIQPDERPAEVADVEQGASPPDSGYALGGDHGGFSVHDCLMTGCGTGFYCLACCYCGAPTWCLAQLSVDFEMACFFRSLLPVGVVQCAYLVTRKLDVIRGFQYDDDHQL